MNPLAELRVAIVHYWFVRRRGGERVVEALAEMFPQAHLYALVADPEAMSPALRKHSLTTSFLQKLPGSHRWHRHLLPLYPLALEQFDFRDYDLVISSEAGPAKGVLTATGTYHICYCHSPMRYIWDLYHYYCRENGTGGISRLAFALTAHYARLWDLATASRVDAFVANSENVAARIRKHYRREASVIYPPVDVSVGYISTEHDDYYLVVGQLVDYKRVDLAIEACNRLQRPLRIVGDGEQYRRLRDLAGPTVELLGFLPDEEVRQLYARCRALLFPGEEDFGMVPVEAQSFGRPVIAYGRGGVLETVIALRPDEGHPAERSTGLFFGEQSVESLVEAIQAFEKAESQFSPPFIRAQVECFDVSRFRREMGSYIARKMAEYQNASSPRKEYIAV